MYLNIEYDKQKINNQKFKHTQNQIIRSRSKFDWYTLFTVQIVFVFVLRINIFVSHLSSIVFWLNSRHTISMEMFLYTKFEQLLNPPPMPPYSYPLRVIRTPIRLFWSGRFFLLFSSNSNWFCWLLMLMLLMYCCWCWCCCYIYCRNIRFCMYELLESNNLKMNLIGSHPIQWQMFFF